ncbi:Xaa-Pro peptidase family protein [Caulobacter segnis]|uniref:M24 family metallopeptidase n=1 Tax=Caulobacter segnis TaxID=88688 RepID=UPI00240F7DB4|nr:Xaa-Pro peptidase family protein [Caulobacter segnis]MDG2520420.1 Xaa-Pro peptidase family protein [Caulobacter segnis]
MGGDLIRPHRRGIMAGLVLAASAPATGFAGARPAPISGEERARRIAKAQGLLGQAGLAALIVEPGSTMIYFCGVSWWLSERPTLLMIPREGEAQMITPAFEEDRLRELLAIPADVRVWQEHEDPYALVAGWLTDRKITSGKIAFDAGVRHFVSDAILKAAPGVSGVSGASVADGCRMIKSPAEIALMQAATDITIAAYRKVGAAIAAGMTRQDITAAMHARMAQLGGATPAGEATIDAATSFPHGSPRPQVVREGSIVLMDFGCTVEGYHADVSRTCVFGAPSAAVRKVWADVRQGQQVAFAAAGVGRPAGSVDDAVRAFYASRGYARGYATPGLTHRTGHGIGLDVHEPINFVHGELTPLAPGMCFSNEPGIYDPGRFGVRIEDCLYMTAQGPRWFSKPPSSIDAPFD